MPKQLKHRFLSNKGFLRSFVKVDYKMLIIFSSWWVDVHLNQPIKIDELIKSANQSIQKCTRDRSDKDNKTFYFWKENICSSAVEI